MLSAVKVICIMLVQQNLAQQIYTNRNPSFRLGRKPMYTLGQYVPTAEHFQTLPKLVPLKTLYEEEEVEKRKEDNLNTNLFFSLDEWPLHLRAEEFQPEVIVDDEPSQGEQTGDDVFTVKETHLSLKPGNIKEEESYFNNKGGKLHAIFHTVEASVSKEKPRVSAPVNITSPIFLEPVNDTSASESDSQESAEAENAAKENVPEPVQGNTTTTRGVIQ